VVAGKTLVDAENVRRSEWPEHQQGELVELVRRWAEGTGAHALIVLRRPPTQHRRRRGSERCRTKGESADDRIARDAENLARESRPYRLVTSDRGLRARAGGAAFDSSARNLRPTLRAA